MTTALRSCPRCEQGLWPQRDMHGGYWLCVKCGYNGYTDVPPERRIERPEVARAHYSAFTYAGTGKAFMGWRIRGRLLPAKKNEMYLRFDLNCPYTNCTRRQRAMTHRQYGTKKAYRCRNDHRINLNLENLTWQ